jgi:hypothetical protein
MAGNQERDSGGNEGCGVRTKSKHKVFGHYNNTAKTHPWLCDICSCEITNGSGYIEITDWPVGETPGGYPHCPTPELEFESPILIGDLMKLQKPQERIAFRVYHVSCDPRPDATGYLIAVERAMTAEQWLEWTRHLTEKNWMSLDDLGRFVKLWWERRLPCVSKGRKNISTKLRTEILERDGFIYHRCGRKAPDVVLHIDHIVPIARGGETKANNLQILCSDCNIGKGAKLPHQHDLMGVR